MTTLKSIVRKRIGQGLLIVFLVGISVWLVYTVRLTRAEVRQQGEVLERLPEEESRRVMLRGELERRRHDIERIKALVARRDQVGEVVNRIKAEGLARDIDVRVVQVVENVEDEEGSTGPFKDVRLKIVGFGDPENLLDFLHASEHLPYLVSVFDWRVSTELANLQELGVAGVPQVAAPSGLRAERPSGPIDEAPKAQMEMVLVLSIINEEE